MESRTFCKRTFSAHKQSKTGKPDAPDGIDWLGVGLMLCRIMDLRCKEVVNINDGSCMGCVSDVEVDTCTAQVSAIVIYGRARLFGLLGREEDTVIPWEDISCIGEATVLVKCCAPPGRPRRQKMSLADRLFG